MGIIIIFHKLLVIILCEMLRCHKSKCYLINMFKHLTMAAAIYCYPKVIKLLIVLLFKYSKAGILKASYELLSSFFAH